MPTGRHRRAAGFTYLLLLFALATGSIGLAALGEQARQRALREQEAELWFRGEEIARAIASYVEAGPGASRSLPTRVDDLLDDRRSGRSVRHLRRLRSDPLGGEWVWLAPGDGGCQAAPRFGPRAAGLSGVRSSSTRPLLRRLDDKPTPACELVFRHDAFRRTLGQPPSPNGSS